MRKLTLLCLICGLCMLLSCSNPAESVTWESPRYAAGMVPPKYNRVTGLPQKSMLAVNTIETETVNEQIEKLSLTYNTYATEENINLLAALLFLEAGGLSYTGQYYTCSAILNFCDVEQVELAAAAHNRNMFQPADYVDDYLTADLTLQYTVIYQILEYGRIPDICYFQVGGYHSFGTPVCYIEGHYFSAP